MPSAEGQYLSPLRYPGGKRRLAPFVGALISAQTPRPLVYVEPFTGGGAVALSLLTQEYVDEIVLNDLDRGVAAFWRCVLEHKADLLDLIRTTTPSLDEWHRQRAVVQANLSDDLALGFATFFLNRVNRSGIVGARPIGGMEQTGKWKIDARWDAESLARRVSRIGRYRSRITVLQEDGIELTRRYLGDSAVFIYADPPYLNKAENLYLNGLAWEDHERLASYLCKGRNWLLTYDCDERIPEQLYPTIRCARFDIAHTAGKQHVGQEYALFAPELELPSLASLGRNARFQSQRSRNSKRLWYN